MPKPTMFSFCSKNQTLRRFLTIVFGATGLACLLGIGIDLVTANVAVEYFSVHHPRITSNENPWTLALFWGVTASWWFGAISGVILASINHRRGKPLKAKKILKWIAIQCVAIWLIMIVILLAVLALTNAIPIEERRASFQSDRRLVAVAMAHQFEYILGAIALLLVAMKTWRFKRQPDTAGAEQSHTLAPEFGPVENREPSPPTQ